MEASFQPFSSASLEAWETVSNRQDDTAAWRSGIQGSILGRMRGIEQAPRGPGGTGVREAGRAAPPDEIAEGIKTFLIADIRGYTVFTQERGDEAGAALAARFADIVREQVEAREGSVTRPSRSSVRLVRRSGRRSRCRRVFFRRRWRLRISRSLWGSGWMPARRFRSRAGSAVGH